MNLTQKVIRVRLAWINKCNQGVQASVKRKAMVIIVLNRDDGLAAGQKRHTKLQVVFGSFKHVEFGQQS